MRTNIKPTLQSSSAYRVYAALENPIIAKALRARYYPTTITGQITSQDVIPSEIRKQGDTIVFRRKPEAEIFTFQKNQDLNVSQLNTEPLIMTIGRADYYNLKLDDVDKIQITDVNMWVREFIDSAVNKMALKTDYAIQTEVPHHVDCQNKGLRAGRRTGMFNLGAMGAPLVVTPNCLVDILGHLAAVLDEAGAPSRGRYVVLPTSAKPLLWANEVLRNASASGMSKSIILAEGEMMPNVLGFNLVFSNATPIYTDPQTGDTTFTLLAGVKEAVGYVMQVNKQEVIDKDSRSFSSYWRGLSLWDFMVLEPEWLAVAYATFRFANCSTSTP